MINSSFSAETAVRGLMQKVYGWMAIALGITSGVAYWVSKVPAFYRMIYSSPGVPLVLFLVQLGLVVFLSLGIKRMSLTTALVTFFAYSALTGVTFSAIFLVYTATSIAAAFLVCAGMFASMSLYGYFTKADLTSLGSFLFMGLIGLIITGLVNMFMKSSGLGIVMAVFGVIIFSLFTAYDAQRIKQLGRSMLAMNEDILKVAVNCSLMLYLDFINLFVYILQFMGQKKD